MERENHRHELTTDAETQHNQEYVYLIPYGSKSGHDLSFLDLCLIVWRRKFLVLAVVTVSLIGAATYSFLSPVWYRSEALLVPAEEMSTGGLGSRSGMFGSLAGIAGISIGGGGSIEPMAVIRSDDFTRKFIEDNDLLEVLLFDRWDSEHNRWKGDDPEDWPDIRDGVRFFDENVRSVTEDRETGLVTLTIDWVEPETAASWANDLIVRINQSMRRRALDKAKRNVQYLQGQLEQTNVAALRESIGTLLEAELQKLMLAQGNEEFAFRVIDRAGVPKTHTRPNLILISAMSVVSGAALAIFFVLFRYAVSENIGRSSG